MDWLRQRKLSFVALLAVQGCLLGGTSSVRSEGPFPFDSDTLPAREGVRYYVARDVIALDARAIKSTSRHWKQNPLVTSSDAVNKLELCIATPPERRWDSTLFTVVPIVVPDFQEGAFRLGMRVNTRASQNLNIDVSQTGILKNVSMDVQDQRAEVVANVFQGIAGVAGTLVGGAATIASKVAAPSFITFANGAEVKRDTVAAEGAFKVDIPHFFRREVKRAATPGPDRHVANQD